MMFRCQKCNTPIGEASNPDLVSISGITKIYALFDALLFCTPCADIIEQALEQTKDSIPHWGNYPSPMDRPHEQIFTTKKEPADDIFNQFLKENGLL